MGAAISQSLSSACAKVNLSPHTTIQVLIKGWPLRAEYRLNLPGVALWEGGLLGFQANPLGINLDLWEIQMVAIRALVLES